MNNIKINSGPSIKSYNKVSNWLEIKENNIVNVLSGKIDIGQHISTTLALICSRELEIDISNINVIKLNTNISPDEGITASSLSVPNSGTAIRAASLTFKKHFLEFVSNRFQINKSEINVKKGVVKDPNSNNILTYWDFYKSNDFQDIVIPETFEINTSEINYNYDQHIEIKTIDEIVTGKYQFIHDMKFDNMLHARIIRPPNYSSKLKIIPSDIVDSLSKKNINIFVQNSFVAILGNDEFEVIKSISKVKHKIVWEEVESINQNDVYELLISNEKDTLRVRKGGEAFKENIPELKQFNTSDYKTITSEFKKPYLMHGSIGPSSACSLFANNNLKIYSHSQSIFSLKSMIAKALNFEESNIFMNFMPGSGCYGHNGADDVAYEVALLSLAYPNKHILLKWTRDDEHAWEPYGSASLNRLSATLDKQGKIVYWSSEVYSDTFMTRPMASSLNNFISHRFVKNDFQKYKSEPRTGAHMGIHRNLDPIYNFPELRMVKNLVHNLPLRTSALRTLGAFANVTASESFMDDLADEAELDPIEFRINHLDDLRAIDLLNDLKTNMNKDKIEANNHRGIGFSRYKNLASYCAVGVEINISDDLNINLINVWISVDAGEIAYKEGIEAQVEGGFIQAASWSLYEEVKYDAKEILSRDWEDYPIIQFDNIPNIKTSIINRIGQPYLGVGEAVAGPTGAAISNAIKNALGERITLMPFSKDNITQQLLN